MIEYVQHKPYSIVLIDKIKKASHKFIMLFLQVLDDVTSQMARATLLTSATWSS